MFLELDQDNLQSIIEKNDKVIVQYAAGWCGNCRIIKPKFKRLAGETEDVAFVVVDAEKYPESRKLAIVNKLPTFTIFDVGKNVYKVQTIKIVIVIEFINMIYINYYRI